MVDMGYWAIPIPLSGYTDLHASGRFPDRLQWVNSCRRSADVNAEP